MNDVQFYEVGQKIKAYVEKKEEQVHIHFPSIVHVPFFKWNSWKGSCNLQVPMIIPSAQKVDVLKVQVLQSW